MTHFYSLILAICLSIFATPLFAKIALIADQIKYNAQEGVLSAVGNVRVYYNLDVLIANRIEYNERKQKIYISDDFTLLSDQGTTLKGHSAVFDTDFETALIETAQAMINEQFQLVAQQVDKQKEKTTYRTVVASTCYIYKKTDTPFWRIRSNQIIHNHQTRRVNFKNATFDFLGVPIFYIPQLSFPEPGVERASGFLEPQLETSNVFGVGLKFPYFYVINNHSDLTFTPFLLSKENPIFELEYRENTTKGSYQFGAVFSPIDHLNNNELSGFVYGRGQFLLRKNFLLSFELNLASSANLEAGEKTFKENYNYSGSDRYHNKIRFEKTTSNSLTYGEASFTQSFRYKDFDGDGVKERDPNVPAILPELYYHKVLSKLIWGGQVDWLVQSLTLINNDDRHYSRIGGRINWHRKEITPKGFVFNFQARLHANMYLNNGGISAQAMPLLMVGMHYPLISQSKNLTHTIEPIAQIIYAPDNILGNTNIDFDHQDSTTAEFEETNLFSINRFPGFDKTEAGLRSNIGLKYVLRTQSGWDLSATIGRVFRLKNLNQFVPSISTGLNSLNSDYVSAVQLKLADQFSLTSRMLFDNNFQASKFETQVSYRMDKLKLTGSYVNLDENSILNIGEKQHNLALNGEYNINDFWKFSTFWRYNLETRSTINGKFGIEYQNECTKLNFLVDVNYDDLGNATTTTGFKLQLLGLNKNKVKINSSHRCGV